MKLTKWFLVVLLAISLMFAVGCSKDDDNKGEGGRGNNGDNNISFTFQNNSDNAIWVEVEDEDEDVIDEEIINSGKSRTFSVVYKEGSYWVYTGSMVDYDEYAELQLRNLKAGDNVNLIYTPGKLQRK